MSNSCDLCGFPLRYGTFNFVSSGETFRFCCMGCKQVFTMLLEASDGADPTSFRETELFKKCQEMGIIPSSEAELQQRAQSKKHTAYELPVDTYPASDSEGEPAGQGKLSLSLNVNHMWCPACAWLIEECLKKSHGVLDAECNFSTDRARCDYDPVLTSPSQIIRTIDGLGFKASIPGKGVESKARKKEFIRFAISAFLTMNVMMLSFALYSGFFTELSQDEIQKLSFPIFVMASIVLFYGGRKIYQRALVGITSAAFSMETLITAGAFSAYFYSTANLLSGSIHLYYDTSSMLITLVLLGKSLESRAKRKVQEGLENFFSLHPTKVRICSDQYPEGRYVAAGQLQVGDVFRVEKGEVLAADGLLIEGKGLLDESSLTGEAEPVVKKAGDRVKSGTRVTQGMFKLKAEGVGEESTLGQMIVIMERALGKRTSLESKTDLALQWFVPIILILAAGTGVICFFSGLTPDNAIIRAVTVMVIACPCTLGIAIPLARVAGISVAGRKGVLVRDFSSFEQAERMNAFVFDKTGTVTTGKWALRQIIPLEPFAEQEVLAMAASLERDSDNYIATEIKRQANENHIDPIEIERIGSFENGIIGQAGKEEIKLGSKEFLAKELETWRSIPMYDSVGDESKYSLVFMSFGGKPCAIFVFGDRIKEDASTAIQQLRNMGHRVILISGDGDKTTKTIARKIGIEEAYGGKLPQEKATFVKDLQQEGYRIAVVGDGINDAPALVQANLAIAVHSGSHLGKEAGDITLMRGEPGQILRFLQLAKKVNKKVLQNLAWSFLYNLISIPVAMSGLLSPLIAVCAMLMSSLSVIGNTLLLTREGG